MEKSYSFIIMMALVMEAGFILKRQKQQKNWNGLVRSEPSYYFSSASLVTTFPYVQGDVEGLKKTAMGSYRKQFIIFQKVKIN